MGIEVAERSEFARSTPANSTTCHFYAGLNHPRPLAPYLCVMAERSNEERSWGETHQRTLKDLVNAQIERLKNTTDLAEIVEIEKITKAYGTVARTVKAVEAMVPEPKAKPVASAAADDDEAPMHDGIPDDPEELHAALAERFAHVADLIERKRREILDGGGEAGSPACVQRDADQRAGAPTGPAG
ncbi:hypothetical protein [Caulobacter segnis]